MTDKQEMFCHEYMKDFNAKRAAETVGYKRPKSKGSELLKEPAIAVFISNLKAEHTDICTLDRLELEKHLSFSLRRDPVDLYDEEGKPRELKDLPEALRMCIDSLKINEFVDKDTGQVYKRTIDIKLTPKMPAIELGMKFLGMIQGDKHEHKHLNFVNFDSLFGKDEGPDEIQKTIDAA